jgi:hypothetical protein
MHWDFSEFRALGSCLWGRVEFDQLFSLSTEGPVTCGIRLFRNTIQATRRLLTQRALLHFRKIQIHHELIVWYACS